LHFELIQCIFKNMQSKNLFRLAILFMENIFIFFEYMPNIRSIFYE